MRRRYGRGLPSACLLGLLMLSASCTGKAEAVRAAQPHLENFADLRVRALNLLELRSDVERQRLLAEAVKNSDEESLPANLKPLIARMRAERVEITDKRLEHAERPPGGDRLPRRGRFGIQLSSSARAPSARRSEVVRAPSAAHICRAHQLHDRRRVGAVRALAAAAKGLLGERGVDRGVPPHAARSHC
jgi:hypothetical protein